MDSKKATEKIVKILKAVKPEGHTKKQQFWKVYLMLKKVDPTIDQLYLTVGKSYNELNQTVEENKKVAAPATEEGLEVGKGVIETETEDLDDLPLDTDLLSPKFQLEGLNVEQIKGWAKMQVTMQKPKKKILIEVAEKLKLPTGGTIDELATLIHETLNA